MFPKRIEFDFHWTCSENNTDIECLDDTDFRPITEEEANRIVYQGSNEIYIEMGGILEKFKIDVGGLTVQKLVEFVNKVCQDYECYEEDFESDHIYFEGMDFEGELDGIPVYSTRFGS